MYVGFWVGNTSTAHFESTGQYFATKFKFAINNDAECCFDIFHTESSALNFKTESFPYNLKT